VASADPGPAWLGVYTRTVDSELAEVFTLAVDQGAIVHSIVSGSPADESGLKVDDIITAVDGQPVTDASDLTELIRAHQPGDAVSLTVVRESGETKIDVTLARSREREKRIERRRSFAPQLFGMDKEERGYLGVMLTDLTDQLGDYFGVENGDGALVTEVEADSPAEKAGLKAGDIIVSVGGTKATSSRDVANTVAEAEPESELSISVVRDREEKTLTATVGKSEAEFWSWTDRVGPDVNRFKLFAPRWHGFMDDDSAPDDDLDALREEMKRLEEQLSEMRQEMKELRDRD
jgi:S1-C subfamily serine protease